MPSDSEANEPPVLGQFAGFEIYPMPIFATLAVNEVAAVAAWYERTLGFGTVFRAPADGGQSSFVHLRRRRYQDLLLSPAQDTGGDAPATLTLSFSADGEVDALAERARGAAPLGRSAIVGPVDTPWNTRDLRVTDPAGHCLVFTGRNPNPDPAVEARMRAMFRGGSVAEARSELGAFSVSLAVKDIQASKVFYEKLGFSVFAGDQSQNWLIMKNGDHAIGLFQGMFEKNILTFNPGWSRDAQPLGEFTDVRELQRRFKARGVNFISEADEQSTGPASFMIADPDGNTILMDQHI